MTTISDAGVTLPDGSVNVSCLAPCHSLSGTGVLDQWRFSKHATMATNTEEQASWLAPNNPCGNCHAQDGLPNRVAKNVGGGTPTNVENGHITYANASGAPAESLYVGGASVAWVQCKTCHDFNDTNDPHVTGQYVPYSAPLRVSKATTFTSWIEKSPAGSTTPVGQAVGPYQRGNGCIWCHKSRKDVTFFITPDAAGAGTNAITNAFWGPHDGPQSDVFTASGAYEYATDVNGNALTYVRNHPHTKLVDGCVDCHMNTFNAPADAGPPDHTMNPRLSTCTSKCHTTATSFDVLGVQTQVKAMLAELEMLLDGCLYASSNPTTCTQTFTPGLLTRATSLPQGIYPSGLQPSERGDGNFQLDYARTYSTPVKLPANVAGALYDYFVMARGSAWGVHNPTYVKQVLYDAIMAVKQWRGLPLNPPVALGSRP